MRGGVSLAVWIGGAMQEIDHLRRRRATSPTTSSASPGFNRLQVDIITGASAGGLNAALAGMAIAHGTSLACLRKVWMDTADIDSLLDMPALPGADPLAAQRGVLPHRAGPVARGAEVAR